MLARIPICLASPYVTLWKRISATRFSRCFIPTTATTVNLPFFPTAMTDFLLPVGCTTKCWWSCCRQASSVVLVFVMHTGLHLSSPQLHNIRTILMVLGAFSREKLVHPHLTIYSNAHPLTWDRVHTLSHETPIQGVTMEAEVETFQK